MTTYLTVMGWYNLAAIPLLLLCTSTVWGQRVLGPWSEIVRPPYSIGDHGVLWVWWSAVINIFYGAVNVLAARWPASAQRAVVWLDLAMYAVFLVLALAASRSPHWGRGVRFCVGLFSFWIVWAASTLA